MFKKVFKSVSLSNCSFFFSRYLLFKTLSGNTLSMEAISLVERFMRKKDANRISFSEISLAMLLILLSKLLCTSEKYDLKTSQSLSSALCFLSSMTKRLNSILNSSGDCFILSKFSFSSCIKVFFCTKCKLFKCYFLFVDFLLFFTSYSILFHALFKPEK